jgi:hypothetical protein
MKKILLLILLSNFCFSQTSIEIRLVNANVGGVNTYSNFPSYTQSTDPNMNIILQNNNVYNYEYKEGHPITSLAVRIIQITGNPNNYTNLMNDLLAYSTVVESAQYTSTGGGFSDAAFIKLVNLNVGTPTGVNSNNIITTNDIGLNQIFINHNVIHYEQLSPNSSNSEILKLYTVACNCNATLLRIDLDTYNTIIYNTEPMPASYLLNSENFNKKNTQIYPNPFQDKITIETDFIIKRYSVYDVMGKKIVETNSNDNLNIQLAELNSGVYLLQLQADDNSIISKKLLKK